MLADTLPVLQNLRVTFIFCAVTMNTQNHSTLNTNPYNVVFGIQPSSEPVPDLTVAEEETDPDPRSDHDDVVSDYENERDNPGSFKNAETLPAINSVVTKTGSYRMLCLIECICIIEEHHCSAAASYTTKDQGGPISCSDI